LILQAVSRIAIAEELEFCCNPALSAEKNRANNLDSPKMKQNEKNS
jgi:hypothetical protein